MSEYYLICCPFCGHLPETHRYRYAGRRRVKVRCSHRECRETIKCESRGKTLPQAGAAWNRRR